MILVDGQRRADIAVADRGLQYGDGCFTTIAYRGGILEFFDLHIKRLQLACERLAIPYTAWPELAEQVAQSINESSQDCVVKVLLSRGQGGRGYSPVGCQQPSTVISHHPMPAHYSELQQLGLVLTVSPIQLAKQPLLAGIKHLNRLEQVLIKHTLADSEYQDALVCDTDNNIVETAIANVFWKKGNIWFTPDLKQCGVEGVARQAIMAVMAKHKIQVQQIQQPLASFTDVEDMFICNSLMKLVPISKIVAERGNIQTQVFTNKHTFELQSCFNQYILEQGKSSIEC